MIAFYELSKSDVRLNIAISGLHGIDVATILQNSLDFNRIEK